MGTDNTISNHEAETPPKFDDVSLLDNAQMPSIEEKGQLVQTSEIESIEKQKSEDGIKTDECIIMVGTTGTGKTTTMNIYTGNDLPTGVCAQSITEETVAVKDKIHPDGPKWIDTPGWADTEGRSDQMLFKQLLKHLQSNKIYKVKAVMWCVMPTPRMDAILQAQAEFIDMFTMDDEKTAKIESGLIWPNVVIVCKGKLDADLEDDVSGAMMAAKKKNIHAKPLACRWEFASPEIISGVPAQLRKDTLRMLTPDEVREEIEEVFKKLPPCVQVVFASKKCLACGQEGDPRLMEDKCHRNIKKGHKGKLQQRFTKLQAASAMGVSGASTIVLGSAAAAAAAPAVLIALPFVIGPGMLVGGHRFLNAPKDDPPPFGGLKITDMRWDCCNMPELKEGGCTDLCDYCDGLWGSSPPCLMIRHPDINMQKDMEGYEVHIKEHDLVDIAVDVEK